MRRFLTGRSQVKGDAVILLNLILVLAVEFVALEQISGQTAAYTVLELSLATVGDQVPYAVNNLGDVAGRARNPLAIGIQATIWSHANLQPTQLPNLSRGDYSFASGINDLGEVVGGSNTGTSILPFVWTAEGGTQRLPVLSGDNAGEALGINQYGHVAGFSSGRNGARAFIWRQSSGIRNLGVLAGGRYSRARAVNDSDEAAGTSDSPSGDRAVLWTASGSIRNLGTLPGDTASEATAINSAGDVVGYSKGPHGMRAILWTAAGGIQNLGVLPGGNNSRALAVNSTGVVVGTSTSSSGDRAFVWTQRGGIQDLNAAISPNLGIILVEAHAINNEGEIVVMGRSSQGSQHVCDPAPKSTFLLIPTSSP
jgi:probable HAF family extracellular repeat protein